MNTVIYKQLIDMLDNGTRNVTLSIFNEHASSPQRYVLSANELESSTILKELTQIQFLTAKETIQTGKLFWGKFSDGSCLLAEPCFPQPRLIVLGGGHIAKPLVEFGAKLGFEITVCDDRISFANQARFPDAHKVICESFEHCLDNIALNSSAYVVIVTRGHRHDMDCYRKIAHHQLAYVGMIGSKRRIAGLRAQLLEEGYASEQLDKLNAPIGLDIGAVTPEEIALSIMSQVVCVRRNRLTVEGAPQNSPELDRAVLNELSLENPDTRAVITVIDTKGSVPRKEGAKMVVWPDGRILGSIGGGCSESDVIGVARDVIREGGFKIKRVDMTGSVAEDEGMVCGGIMDVLIEAY